MKAQLLRTGYDVCSRTNALLTVVVHEGESDNVLHINLIPAGIKLIEVLIIMMMSTSLQGLQTALLKVQYHAHTFIAALQGASALYRAI
jgi:hypothetical protein